MAATVGLDFSSAIILQMSQKRYLLSIGTRIKIFILAQALLQPGHQRRILKTVFSRLRKILRLANVVILLCSRLATA
jgi:hypothetical protein